MTDATQSPQGWSPKQLARATGAFYLVIIVCGIWTELFVRGSIVVPGMADHTARQLQDFEMLFRMGFVAETIMAIADVAVVVLLFLLLRVVSMPLALAAAAFHLTQTAVLVSNTMTTWGALVLLKSEEMGRAFTGPQIEALAYQGFTVHAVGYSLALIFFGVNCVLLGILIWRSGFLPKFLGALMFASGLVYLITSEVRFAVPDYYGAVQPAFIVCLIAELALALWLLVRGVNEAKWG